MSAFDQAFIKAYASKAAQQPSGTEPPSPESLYAPDAPARYRFDPPAWSPLPSPPETNSASEPGQPPEAAAASSRLPRRRHAPPSFGEQSRPRQAETEAVEPPDPFAVPEAAEASSDATFAAPVIEPVAYREIEIAAWADYTSEQALLPPLPSPPSVDLAAGESSRQAKEPQAIPVEPDGAHEAEPADDPPQTSADSPAADRRFHRIDAGETAVRGPVSAWRPAPLAEPERNEDLTIAEPDEYELADEPSGPASAAPHEAELTLAPESAAEEQPLPPPVWSTDHALVDPPVAALPEDRGDQSGPVEETPSSETAAVATPPVEAELAASTPIDAAPVQTSTMSPPRESQPVAEPVETSRPEPPLKTMVEAEASLPAEAFAEEAREPLAPDTVSPAASPETTDVEQGATAFRPHWEIDSFAWPDACEELLEQRGTEIEGLASRLLEDAAHGGPRVIAVAGCGRGVGASTFALCLARAAGQFGGPIALVDGDFEEPVLAGHVDIEAQSGWEEALVGRCSLESVALLSLADNVCLLPTLQAEAAAAAADRVPEALLQLGSCHDLVIVDLGAIEPNATSTAATPPPAQALVAALIVQDHRRHGPDEVRSVANQLAAEGLPTLGVIENFAVAAAAVRTG